MQGPDREMESMLHSHYVDNLKTVIPATMLPDYMQDTEKSVNEMFVPQTKSLVVTETEPELTKTDIKIRTDITTSDVDLNALSQQVIYAETAKLKPFFEKEFIGATKGVFIESGCAYDFEDVFEKYNKRNKLVAVRLLSDLLCNHYNDDINITTAILHTISHYSYSELEKEFIYIVLTISNKKKKKIKKFALKIFDNWDEVETLKLLKGNAPLHERWLEDYRQSIIEHLEGKRDAILGTSN